MEKRVLLIIPLFLALSLPAFSQYSTKGLYFRPHLAGAAWSIEEIDESGHSGGGAGMGAAYGFTEWLSVFVDLSGARMETKDGGAYTLAHFDLGAQFVLTRPESPFKVFVDVAGSGRTARFEVLGHAIDLDGGGGTLGFGMMYFMSNSVALDGGLQAMFGTIDRISGGGAVLDLKDVRANSVRFNFGIAWFPGR